MRRRDFIEGIVGAVTAWPLAGRAQQRSGKIHRIGLLTRKTDASVANQINALRHGLRALAAELVALNVDVIVTVDTPPTLAAKQATSTIPIVVAVSADPVGAGLVSSLAHPGGNTTGLALLAPETDQKGLEFLKQALPKTNRVVMIVDSKNPGMMLRLKAIQSAAPKLAIELQSIPALGSSELVDALAAAKEPPDALFVLSPIYAAYRKEIAEFATKKKLPILFDTSGLAGEPGALLSYGADISDLFRRAATFVDKILKGARPADLPVEQPTKFELVINLKTAKALGIDVPMHLQQIADEVIE